MCVDCSLVICWILFGSNLIGDDVLIVCLGDDGYTSWSRSAIGVIGHAGGWSALSSSELGCCAWASVCYFE